MDTDSRSPTNRPAPAGAALDERRIRRAFATAAASYDDADFLQSEIRSRLLDRLDWVRLDPRRVLDLGTGTGRALTDLAQRYPEADLVAADLALPMATAAAGKALAAAVCCNAAHLPFADRTFDVVFSNLVLHWCSDLDAAFREARRVLRHPGLFTFTTPGPRAYQELRTAWGEVDQGTHVMLFPDMRALGDGLIRAGFAEPVVDVETITVRYDTLRMLLRDLRATGTTNAAADRPRGLTGRGRWQRFEKAFERLRDQDGKLPLTVEVLFGHAWVPGAVPGRRSSGTEIVIPIDTLRRRQS